MIPYCRREFDTNEFLHVNFFFQLLFLDSLQLSLDHIASCCPPLPEQGSVPSLAAAAAVRRRLAGLLRAADSTMQRRLAQVSTELAQTDTELLCERAHSQHLAQERKEVAERERSLSRQVDVAVMVIAALREQLNASENELERRER